MSIVYLWKSLSQLRQQINRYIPNVFFCNRQTLYEKTSMDSQSWLSDLSSISCLAYLSLLHPLQDSPNIPHIKIKTHNIKEFIRKRITSHDNAVSKARWTMAIKHCKTAGIRFGFIHMESFQYVTFSGGITTKNLKDFIITSKFLLLPWSNKQ